MTALPNLAGRIFGVPLLIEPQAAATILSVLGDKLEIGAIVVDGTAVDLATARSRGRERAPREYGVTDDGIVLVPVLGTLTSRSMSLRPASGMTGYDSVERAFEQAMSDPSVHGVLMQLDSPGGEAGGALEAARFIRSLRGQKPIWAIADHQAASSAYALASAADRIIMPRGGDVGSVGVLGLHTDRSGELSQRGRKVTVFRRGARKADGHPFGPLEQEAADRIGARLDSLYGEFAELVASNRGLSLNAVYATEGDTFSGADAVRLGLADAVLDPREAMQEFRNFLQLGPVEGSAIEEKTMPTTTYHRPVPPAPGASMEQVRQELTARFTAVMNLPDAAGPLQPLAQHLALSTSLEVEEAAGILALAKQAAKAGGGHTDFKQAMAKLRNPTVGPDDGVDGVDESLDGLLARARAREGRV
jgi:capsid assembly protease